jgi:oxygen-independent coproporphyrinogen-3 oxidase
MSGLYIHIPFCRKKCDYCDFYSVADAEKIGAYVGALVKEAELFGRVLKNMTFDTAYFGGGTPSLLRLENFEKIFGALRKNFCLNSDAEITVEGNPSDFRSEEKLRLLRELGANRISVGIQTMNDETLKKIGRAQTAADNLSALEKISENFDNFSADIMLGLPDEGLKDVEKTLKTVLDFGAKHISAYALKVEENTPLQKNIDGGRLEICGDDMTVDIYDLVLSELKKRGIERYEISNFSAKNYECRHNLNYWKRREYLGLGAAAHSFLNGARFENPRDIDAYIERQKSLNSQKNNSLKCAISNSNPAKNQPLKDEISGLNSPKNQPFESIISSLNPPKITSADALFEKIMLGLRLKIGINIAETDREFGVNFMEKYSIVLKKYGKCFDFKDGNIAVKDEYFYAMNSLILEFM